MSCMEAAPGADACEMSWKNKAYDDRKILVFLLCQCVEERRTGTFMMSDKSRIISGA